MYDAWAIYHLDTETYLVGHVIGSFQSQLSQFDRPDNVTSQRETAISYAAYRLLSHRFASSPGASPSQARFDRLMLDLGYDIENYSTDITNGDGAAMGNTIAEIYINYGLQDGSNEFNDYQNIDYAPVNPPLSLNRSGNLSLLDLNRWQPLSFEVFIDQSGIQGSGTPEFLGAEWGEIIPFALTPQDKIRTNRNTGSPVYHDPGTPWQMNQSPEDLEEYIWNFSLVANWSSHLDPSDNVLWDISPKSLGNNPPFPDDMTTLDLWYDYLNGGEPGTGYLENPVTQTAYESNIVPRGDYARVLAEFWADGPDSETPPGHWFSITTGVLKDERLIYRYKGQGEILDPLEYQLKLYFTLGGALHDAAIAAWDIKAEYDYIRPISYIRWAADKQRENSENANYSPLGLPIIPEYIEQINQDDPQFSEFAGDMKIKSWRGPRVIFNPDINTAGVGWIKGDEWWPYQRSSFVTPPFAGYVSGHSTFSRAAAEVLAEFTGSPFFPGGMGTFLCKKDEFLVFENGPSVDIELQWATYFDASDQSGLSRIWGGIHPPIDDIPGRKIGIKVGQTAMEYADKHFDGSIEKTTAEFQNLESIVLSVVPNPVLSGDLIRIDLGGIPAQTIELFISDLQGRVHYSEKVAHSNRILDIYPTIQLSSGTYFVSFRTNTGITVKKFVVL